MILCLFYALANIVSGQRPHFEWAKSIKGDKNIYPSTILTDFAGNTVIAGTFSGTIDFDPGTNIFNLTSAGYFDVFILKLNQQGNLVWAKKIGSEYSDHCNNLALDNNGNIYMTGTFSLEVDFNPGSGIFNLISRGANDIFVLKLNSSGEFGWAASMGDDVSDEGTSITVGQDGNVLVTGWFQGTVDFDPGIGLYNYTALGVDCFILKLNPSGNFIWAKMAGGVGIVEGHTIKTDKKNNIYISGLFKNTVDFDPGTGKFEMQTAQPNSGFLLKLNKSGDFKWAIQPGGDAVNTNLNRKRPMAIDANDQIILTYLFSGSVDFDPGTDVKNLTSNGRKDIFIQKLDTLGKLLWVKQIGGVEDEESKGVAVDNAGNIYTTGYFTGTVDFDAGAGKEELSAGGEWNSGIFVSKLNANGEFIWAYDVKRGDDSWPYGTGTDLTLDASNNVMVAGEFTGKLDFNPGSNSFILSTSTDIYDTFILKLKGLPSDVQVFEEANKWMAYPNPFSDLLNILTDEYFQDGSVVLRSITGQVVATRFGLTGKNFTLDMKEQSDGIYILEIQNRGTRYVSKVIKQ